MVFILSEGKELRFPWAPRKGGPWRERKMFSEIRVGMNLRERCFKISLPEIPIKKAESIASGKELREVS